MSTGCGPTSLRSACASASRKPPDERRRTGPVSRGLIMKCIISVNPFDCRMWDMHDRLDALVTEGSCKSEIESFAKHGQLIPVLGRPLPPDGTHKYELIYGARRLLVARHLNIPLLLEVRPMSDREGLIAMDIENRQRADISP